MIRPLRVSRWRSAIQPNVASLQRRAMKARRFGVRSAMPSTIAIRKCAEIVFVPPRFDVYREVSNQIHTIFKGYTPLFEPLSLDEAYLDVTDNLKGIPTAWETAKEIRARI